LSIHRLYLTQFPDLTANTNLVELIAHTNKFASIPALNFPLMESLNLSLANVTVLPDLSTLPKLKKLECFRNSITQLPDLSMLDSLKIVDASTNLINQFPALPSKTQILYLDNNLLTQIPDMAPFTSLSKVRLYKNFLSFADLLPLTSLSNFSTVFEIAPQKNFPVGFSQAIVEPAGFNLDSKIDSNVAGVTRSWYFNNALTAQTGRYFTKSSTVVADQGNYYATFAHPSIPGLILQTDNFAITVIPCVNLNGVNLEVTETTCIKQGTLKVTLSNQPASAYTFNLEGVQTHKKLSNTTGQFTNLEDLSYQLTIEALSGCKYTLPSAIEIPREYCKQIVITPNGDNVDDTYYFQQSGSARIVDKSGNLVGELSLPVLWDGNINGRKVPVGYYLININNGEEILKLSVIH
jgi:internalin A